MQKLGVSPLRKQRLACLDWVLCYMCAVLIEARKGCLIPRNWLLKIVSPCVDAGNPTQILYKIKIQLYQLSLAPDKLFGSNT